MAGKLSRREIRRRQRVYAQSLKHAPAAREAILAKLRDAKAAMLAGHGAEGLALLNEAIDMQKVA